MAICGLPQKRARLGEWEEAQPAGKQGLKAAARASGDRGRRMSIILERDPSDEERHCQVPNINCTGARRLEFGKDIGPTLKPAAKMAPGAGYAPDALGP